MYHGICSKCTISENCAYFNIFDLENAEVKNQGKFYTPRPYTLRDLPSRNRIHEGELISIGFTLLGESNKQFIPYLFATFNNMETYKYGKNELSLKFYNITDHDNNINLNTLDNLSINFGRLSEDTLENNLNSYEIQFQTPLRIKFQGKQMYNLDKLSFLSTIKNRYKTLHECYGNFNEDDLKDIDDFDLISVREKVTNNKRFSSRQNKKHYLPGIIGNYKITSNNFKLFKILKRLENLQIGKSTTFGFGQFKIIA